MKKGQISTVLAVIGLVFSFGADDVCAQQKTIEVDGALKTTYVFRGNPQYVDDETPSLEFNGKLGFEGQSGIWIIALQAQSSLNQRKANEKLGSADEFVPSLSYKWNLTPDHQWSFGVVDYFRPHDSQTNFRTEAFMLFEWDMVDVGLVTLKPFVGVYGEFWRLRGVFGEVGADFMADLDEGFTLDAVFRGGLSQYSEGTENFNHISVEVALSYAPPELSGLKLSGFISSSLTQNEIFLSTDFLERHNVTWSGLRVTYATRPTRALPTNKPTL
jgi:hypothetical protein